MSINPTNDIRYKTCLNFWLRKKEKKKKLKEWAYWWASFKSTVAELLSEWEPHKGAQFPVELTWGRSGGGIRALERLNKGTVPRAWHDMTWHDMMMGGASRGCCRVGGQLPRQESWAHLASSLQLFRTTVLTKSTHSCTKLLSDILFHSTGWRWTRIGSSLAQGVWGSRTQPGEVLRDVLCQDSRDDWPWEATRVVQSRVSWQKGTQSYSALGELQRDCPAGMGGSSTHPFSFVHLPASSN